MVLEKRFYTEASRPSMSKGTSIPLWNGNINNMANWYSDSDINFFYNIVDNDDIYIQYGRDATGWASARFIKQTLEIINQTTNPDGTITATIKTQVHFFNGRKNSHALEGFDVSYLVKVNNVIQYQFTGNSIDDFNQGSRPSITFDVIVTPEETNLQGALTVEIKYPNDPQPDNIFTVGFGLFNPIPPTYIPMTIRKSNMWKDFNSNNGNIFIRNGNNWIDKSNENVSTSRNIDKGFNRIRRTNNWRQLPRMSGGNSV